MDFNKVQMELDGKQITIEQGRVANQANGAVLLTVGETVVLATACMSKKPREGMNFFPLLCDYEEKKHAVGKIPGGFQKRGGRPSDRAVLVSRLIDRPLRPLFPDGMRNDVQVICSPLSMEPDNPADMYAVMAASCALSISDIPWHGPLGCSKICKVDGELVVNPSLEQVDASEFELVIASTEDRVMEIEFEGQEIPEDEVYAAIELAVETNKKFIALQKELVSKIGLPKTEVELVLPDEELYKEISDKVSERIASAIRDPEKSEKESAIFDLRDQIIEELTEEYEERADELGDILEKIIKKQVRKMILDEGCRPDGREMTKIRTLKCDVGLLPRVHGSGLFSRGQTQVMTLLTLGGLDEAQIIDTLEEDTDKRFMHFYNFPPYSVGEVRPLRGAGRREVGHGSLAEKALRPVVPPVEDFPYTILMTSEVMESNGSTSMASTCGATLSLMDAGVKLKAPVAGISVGLVTNEDESKKVLMTDIQALEDFTGDMDFKVCGTRDGITAIQVDTKLQGLSMDIVREALSMAKDGRNVILDAIAEVIPAPREELSKYAPSVFVIEIHPDQIGNVIGPGGKVIKKIEADTGAKLDIEQDGHIYITAPDAEGGEKARKIIDDLTREVKVGEVYTGIVNRVEDFGAFVEILPGRDGLVHISQLDKERVNQTQDVCNLGDELLVRVIGIGDDGKISLTRRGLIEGDEDYDYTDQPPRRSGGGGGGGGGRDRGGSRGGGRDGGRDRRDRGDRGGKPQRSDGPKKDRDDDGPRVSFRSKN